MSWKKTITTVDDKDSAPVMAAPAPTSSWRDTVIEAPESTEDSGPDLLTGAGNATIGGAVGYGTGKLVQGGAALGNKILEGAGDLDKESMNFITQNPDKYKSAISMSDKLNEYRDLADKTRQSGFDFKNKALQSLEGAPAIPTKDYFSSLAKVAGKEDYTMPLGDNVKNSAFQSALAEVQPDIDAKTGKLKELESKMSELQSGKPNRDVRLQANQQAKIAKGEVKLKRIDEKIATATEKAQETAIKRREDFLANQNIDNTKTELIQTDKHLKKFDDQVQTLEKLKADKAKIANEIVETQKKAAEKAKSSVQALSGIPAELDIPDRKVLFDNVGASLDRAVKTGRGADSIPAMSIAKGVIPGLRDGNNYEVGAGYSQALDKDISEQVRQDFGDRFKDYDENMKNSSNSIKTQDKFQKLGVDIDPATGAVTIPENKRKFLTKIISSGPDEYVDEKKLLAQIPDDLKGLGIMDQNSTFLDDLKASALKQKVADASSLKNVTGWEAANLAKGSPTGVIKAGLDNLGTKAQEMAALTKGGAGFGGKAGKAAMDLAGGAVKYAPGILGVGGAMIGAGSAMAAGDIDAPEAGVLAATDIVNPLPLDTTGGYVAGKQAYKDNINDQKVTDDYFNGKDVEQVPAIKAGLEAGAKASVQPIKDLGNAIEEGGFQRSTDARARMEQNMNAYNSLKAKQEVNPYEKSQASKDKAKVDFKGFQKVSNDDLKGLAQKVGQHAQGSVYSGPLEKAANAADERTKNAVLWGLYQQPAFRQIYKDINPDTDTEE